jgi:phage replication initiation protein
MARKSIPKEFNPADTQRYSFNPPDIPELELEVAKALHAGHARRLEAKRAVAAALAAPRRVTPECPPLGNTGGKLQTMQLVTDDGVIKEVPQRRGWGGDSAFVDWVNFTCHESSFFNDKGPITDIQVIEEVSRICQSIFGYGITKTRDRGANFYQRSYDMTDDKGQKFGLVCHGGQRDTVLVSISGEGCAAAAEGWEIRLFAFLKTKANNARITRIDLAFDDFDGSFLSVEALDSAFDQGGFNCGGRNPDIEHRGNWKSPNGKGRTLYVGHRSNGKYFRGYEKGKQLGSPESAWVRSEVEFKSVDKFLPFDMLLKAGEYLAAAYPVLECLSDRQERILTIQKTVQASYERTKSWLKNQCGAALNLMLQVEQNAETVLALIVREGKFPRGLNVPDFRNCGEFFHEMKREQPTYAAFVDATFST